MLKTTHQLKRLDIRRIHRGVKDTFKVSVLIGLLSFTTLAEALTINFVNTGAAPMTAQQQAAFDQAADLWESRFSDPITLTINVAWLPPGNFANPNVALSTAIARMQYAMTDVKQAMILDADSESEENAMQLLNGRIPIADMNGIRDDFNIIMSMANAKALGLSTGQSSLFGNPEQRAKQRRCHDSSQQWVNSQLRPGSQ